MANKRLPMRKIREVLRLSHACGLGEREIARSCRIVSVNRKCTHCDGRKVTHPLTVLQPPFLSDSL